MNKTHFKKLKNTNYDRGDRDNRGWCVVSGGNL